MRNILLISIVVLNLFAVEVVPSWYPSKTNKVIVSYGDGKSFEEAKNNAFLNLKQENKLLNDIKISDLEIEEEDFLENQFFLKVKYTNLSIYEQLKNVMRKITFQAEDENNKYLLNTKLLKDLNSTFGYFPDIKIKGQHLSFNNKKFLLKDKEFSLLLSELDSNAITLDIKDKLLNNEKYFIKLSPTIDGYITLVQISNYTDVEVLFSNKTLEKGKFTIFPNFKLSDGLEVVLDNDVNSSEILTMAIVCEKQKDFSSFNNMFLSISMKKYMLGELIDEIDDCTYQSVLTTVKK